MAGQFDLNKYVVSKTLDGLSLMLGEEQREIRKDPAAQITSMTLLRKDGELVVQNDVQK